MNLLNISVVFTFLLATATASKKKAYFRRPGNRALKSTKAPETVAPTFAPTPSLSTSPTAATTAGRQCFTGTAAEIFAQCEENQVNCCSSASATDHTYACDFEGPHITVCEGSCNGADSCWDVGSSTTRNSGSITIEEKTCVGEKACERVGFYTLDKVALGPNSCQGQDACDHLEWWYTENTTIAIGSGSCLGEQACYELSSDGWLNRVFIEPMNRPHEKR